MERVVKSSSSIKTKDLVLSAMLVALVFVATRFINLRLPISINGGLIHAGNAMLFMASIVFGKKKGAIAGAFGMGLFDILSGWLAWAPFTFIIRGLMGYIIGHISNLKSKGGNSIVLNLIAITVGGICMIIGYYFTEVLLYGNWITPFTSVPGNVIQIVAGAVLGLPLVIALKKTKMV